MENNTDRERDVNVPSTENSSQAQEETRLTMTPSSAESETSQHVSETDTSDISAVTKNRLPRMCEICESTLAKYTCPRCEIRTCSVPCVKEHKSRLGCSGERNKTAFVDMSQYSHRHLLNDYRLLEEAERSCYRNKMMPKDRHRGAYGAPYHMNKRSKLLVTAAYKRGVRLDMVSPALSRSRTNSSFYTISTDTIAWHIEWHFVSTNTVIKDEKVPETTHVIDAARKFVNFVEYPHLMKLLQDYKKDSLDNCRFLLKVEGLPANTERYFQLNPESSIAKNLEGHCIVEYPNIFVLPPNMDDSNYTVLSKVPTGIFIHKHEIEPVE